MPILTANVGCPKLFDAAGGVSVDVPHPTSVVAAAVHSSMYGWASYTAALQSSLGSCCVAQQQTQVGARTCHA